LQSVAHESLTIVTQSIQTVTRDLSALTPLNESVDEVFVSENLVTFDTAQHLVSVAAGESANDPSNRTVKKRLAALLEMISGPRFESDR